MIWQVLLSELPRSFSVVSVDLTTSMIRKSRRSLATNAKRPYRDQAKLIERAVPKKAAQFHLGGSEFLSWSGRPQSSVCAAVTAALIDVMAGYGCDLIGTFTGFKWLDFGTPERCPKFALVAMD